jgi:lysophospholipase L1-like esterase
MAWEKVLILGDSNTQYGFANWLSLLADKLQRRCDVINRGFSGYTTRFIKLILPKIMSEFEAQIHSIRAIVILLGTNDSAINQIQHVDLDEFASNYQWIIDYLQSVGITNDKIIIMTPQKIDDDKWSEYRPDSTHSDKYVKPYSFKCKAIAEANQIAYVDLYDRMEASTIDFRQYFHDGLHFSLLGGHFVMDNLWPVIDEKLIAADKLKINFPIWSDIKYTKDMDTLEHF